MTKTIAINAGSSSLKWQLYEMPDEVVLAKGLIERIGLKDSVSTVKFDDRSESQTLDIADHVQAVKILLDDIFGKNNLVNEIIWFYDDSPGRSDKFFPKKHDTIFWYKKNEYIFNDKEIRVDILGASKERYQTGRTLGGREYIGGESAEIGKIPEDVWKIPVVKGNAKENVSYATQKPSKLIERIIKASSKVILSFPSSHGFTYKSYICISFKLSNFFFNFKNS